MENSRKNIAIGKIGKSIKMSNIHIETGGGAELVLYSTMAKMYPEYNFYFIGPNELAKCSQELYDKLFPNHNVYSAWVNTVNKTYDYSLITKYFDDNDIKIDFAIIFNGMAANVNIKGFLNRRDGQPCSPLVAMCRYAAPLLYALNKLECPLYIIAEDAKYVTVPAADLYNRERLIFTQINGDFTTKAHILSGDDVNRLHMKKTVHKAKYAHIEKIFMMGMGDAWKENIDFEAKQRGGVNPVIVLSNGQGCAKINSPSNIVSSRLPEYKKYIIDNFKGTPYEGAMIYGNWPDDIMKEYDCIKNVSMFDLGDEVKNAKYTLVYSQVPGFVTCKAYEMFMFGLLPFLHPDYDCYHLLDLPEYLYVKDEKDFLNKIDYLEQHPEKYRALMEECFALVKPEYLDGSFIINNMLQDIADDMGFEFYPKPGIQKSIFDRFSKEFIK